MAADYRYYRVSSRFPESPDCVDGPYHHTEKGVCLDCGLPQAALYHQWLYLLWLLHGEDTDWRIAAMTQGVI